MSLKKPRYNLSKLAAHIKKRRLALGLSREELAVSGQINYNTIIKLESGANTNPTIGTLIGIAGAFKVGVEELIR